MFSYLILGLIQGLTEFLPISSSGHLVLATQLFQFKDLDPAFNVFVQGGTVLSVLIFFRKIIPKLSLTYFKLIIIGSIPAAVIGIIFSDFIDAIFSSLLGVSLGFFLTTVFLFISRRSPPNTAQTLSPKPALFIGFAQALAILPGLSRSGSTITTGLQLGISKEEAFSFSFLLSIPALAGAALLSLNSLTWNSFLAPQYLLGLLVASITGYFSLVLLNKLLKQGKFYLFAPYTAFLGVVSLFFALIN